MRRPLRYIWLSRPRVMTFTFRYATTVLGEPDAGNGSGLIGLVDRVEALGGRIDIVNIGGDGTSLDVLIPLERDVLRGGGASSACSARGT